jgi:hypothetical protein
MDVYSSLLNNATAMIRGDAYDAIVEEHFFRSCHYKDYHVCVMWNPEAKGHKYIAALTPEQSFIVAMPLTFIELHKNILKIVQDAISNPDAYCPGGGFLQLEQGTLTTYSASQDFGAWDHELADKAFSSIVIEPHP